MKRSRTLFVAGFSAIVTASCGGESEYPPGSTVTGSSDAGSMSTIDAAQQPVGDPSPAQVTAFCNALTGYSNTCNVGDSCTLNQLSDCTYGVVPAGQGGSYSAAFVVALTACLSANACVPSASPMNPASPCFQTAIGAITPTATQRSIAKEYCATCASAYAETTAQCEAAFFSAETGEGTAILAYDDAVAEMANSQCTQTTNDPQACGVYFGCTQDIASSFYQCAAGTP